MADTLESIEVEVKHSASGAAEEISKVTSNVQSLGQALGSVLPQLRQFKSALDTKASSGLSEATQQTAENINNIKNSASGAKSATRDAAKGIGEMSKAAGKSSGNLGKFISSLKRIAMYRLLRTVIKEITQAFQEGMQWAYQFSAGVDGEGNRFASAMDRIKTAGSTMKAQLGSAFISLIAALEPIITSLCNLMTRLADAISQVFASFTGTTYLKAAEVPQQWADAAGNAGRAAKEWKNQLMGFDEINRLEEPSKGGGGGSTGVDPSQMFTDSPIGEWAMKIHDWWDQLKEKVQNSGIVEAFNNLKDAAEKFANSEFFTKVMEIVGILLNGALTIVLDTIKGILNLIADLFNGDLNQGVKDFKDLLVDIPMDALIMVAEIFDKIFGTNIAEWLEELKAKLKELDPTQLPGFEKLQESVEKFKEAWQTLKDAVSAVFQKIGEAFGANGAGTALQDFLVLLFGAGFDFLLNSIAVQIEAIANGINILASIINGDLTGAINGLKNLWVDFVFGAFEALFGFIDDLFGTDIVGWIKNIHQTLKDFDLGAWVKNAIKDVGGFFKSVGQWIAGAVKDVGDFFGGILKWCRDFQLKFFGFFESIGEGVWKFFTETIPNMFHKFADWWHSLSLPEFHIPSPHFEWTYTEATGIIAKALEFVGLPATIPHLNISWYAQGGFPQEGDLFFANERGAEMVGSMNGRTAVANNDQIVEGIRQGVFEAVSAAMNNGGQDVNVKVYLDSHQIKAGQQRLSRAMGV